MFYLVTRITLKKKESKLRHHKMNVFFFLPSNRDTVFPQRGLYKKIIGVAEYLTSSGIR